QVRRSQELEDVVEVAADEMVERGLVLHATAGEEGEVACEAPALDALELLPHADEVGGEGDGRPVAEVDAVIRVAAREREVVAHPAAGRRERLLENLGHEENRRAGVEREAVERESAA